MCRLLAYCDGPPVLAADLLLRPSRSIVRQSFDARERSNARHIDGAYTLGALNADGFGLAFYTDIDPTPCVFTESQPAWNSKNLKRLSEKVKSKCFLAHVRAAGPGMGAVCDCKTHPFAMGRYSWMHNGEIAGFCGIRRRLLGKLKHDQAFDCAISHGTTDTAVCFGIFLDQIMANSTSSPALACLELLAPTALVHHLQTTMRIIMETMEEFDVRGASKLNFVVSDGHTTLACRYTIDLHKHVEGASLYYASGCSFAPTLQNNEEDEDELLEAKTNPPLGGVDYRIFHSEKFFPMTIVASEPLTSVRDDWVRVPNNHCVVVTESTGPLCAPLYVKFAPCCGASLAVSELERALSTATMVRYAPSLSNLAANEAFMPTKLGSLRGSGGAAAIFSKRRLSPLPESSPLSDSNNGSSFFSNSMTSISSSKRGVLLRGSLQRSSSTTQEDSSSSLLSMESSVSGLASPSNALFRSKTHLLRGSSIGFSEFSSFSNPGKGFFQDEVDVVSTPVHALSKSGQVSCSALVRFGEFLFSADGGVAGGRVCVYDLKSKSLIAWSKSFGVLALCCIESEKLLLGSRSDGYMFIWDISNLNGELGVFSKIRLPRIGHVLSMVAISKDTIVIGSQDGNVRRIVLPPQPATTLPPRTGSARHKCEFRVVELPLSQGCGCEDDDDEVLATYLRLCVSEHRGSGNIGGNGADVEHAAALAAAAAAPAVPSKLISRSHCGLVTSIVQGVGRVVFSGSTCGMIKKWDTQTNRCVETIGGHTSSVLDLCYAPIERALYSCSTDGTVRCRDVSKDTSLLSRTFYTKTDAMLSRVVVFEKNKMLVAGSLGGACFIWDLGVYDSSNLSDFPLRVLDVSSCAINALAIVGPDTVAVGAASGRVTLWRVPASSEVELPVANGLDMANLEGEHDEMLLDALSKFVAIPSISSDGQHVTQCLEAARFILETMEGMGCETRYFHTKGLPCVLGRVASSKPNPGRKYVFVYGHYDVVAVNDSQSDDAWETNPWHVIGREGYLHGRGVSDNKGPCLAMLFAATACRDAVELGFDVVFCFEGEEETGISLEDRSFVEVLSDPSCRSFLGPSAPLFIMVSNNVWVDEGRCCLTHGVRGVMDLEIQITGAKRDVHSGVHGGALFEPMDDLVSLLNTTPALRVALLEKTASPSESDLNRFERVAFNPLDFAKSLGLKELQSNEESGVEMLSAMWAQPWISTSGIQTSNAMQSFRRIPKVTSARLSIHFVPGLHANQIREMVSVHFRKAFAGLKTPNRLNLVVHQVSDWWVGDPTSLVFSRAADALRVVWGHDPVLIREGGSDGGVTAFLERELKSSAVHIPMAQANDFAHLENERIGLLHLLNGRDVFREMLKSWSFDV